MTETPDEPLAESDQDQADLEAEPEDEEGLDGEFDGDEEVEPDDSPDDPGSGGDGTEEGEVDDE